MDNVLALRVAGPAQAASNLLVVLARKALLPLASDTRRLRLQLARFVDFSISTTVLIMTWNTLDLTTRRRVAITVPLATLDPRFITAIEAHRDLAAKASLFRLGFACRVLPGVVVVARFFTKHVASPDMFILALLLPSIVDPFPILGACLVATRPMLVLHVARAVRGHTALGARTIFAIVGARRGGQNRAIPNLLVLLVPCIVLPLVVGVACRIATRPSVILLETSGAPFNTTLRIAAISPVLCALGRGVGEFLAIPHLLIDDTPIESHPLVVVGASGVAA